VAYRGVIVRLGREIIPYSIRWRLHAVADYASVIQLNCFSDANDLRAVHSQ
jgi:hypothetical protein